MSDILSSNGNNVFTQIENLLNVGIALTAEKDHNRLLELIVTEARNITNCDAGTLYLRQGEQLVFKIIQTQSQNVFQGGSGEEIKLPPVKLVKDNVSAYVALTGQTVNIPDVYFAEGFDFSGPRKYDKITGYRTQSMLVVPMGNHEGEIIGVLQLINSLEDDNLKVRVFPEHYQKVIESLASQAAIALTNAQLLKDIENLFKSFVEVMATAIDARTPYNANHTRRVAMLARATAEAINIVYTGPFAHEYFNTERLEQLTMAGWLHDIGKVTTPLSVMDKATRLEGRIEIVLQRLDYIYQLEKTNSLARQMELLKEGRLQEVDQESSLSNLRLAKVKEIKDLIIECDSPATFINDQILEQLQEAASYTYYDAAGIERPYISDKELECLSVRKGTLTDGERKIMEQHVTYTGKMLEKITFIKKLKDVPVFASMHHEFLDGKGYPGGLKGEDIPLEGRILCLVDIYDALTAGDRPYKKAMTWEEALRILGFMIKEGKLDEELFNVFKEYRVWEKVEG
ncbi:MAG: Cyclic di-GMP phosphodiesterase response regulator RpfG [Pelotomaculum sp. PtaU1.Bin035]|nr:MAG: Cyclic di-GMP phosphodiesterase response regulator RpfG [Pelotomaculum sp. PtaU1.Bin035]